MCRAHRLAPAGRVKTPAPFMHGKQQMIPKPYTVLLISHTQKFVRCYEVYGINSITALHTARATDSCDYPDSQWSLSESHEVLRGHNLVEIFK